MKEAKLKGWIKLHRKMLNWEWYDYPNVWRVFTHCILKANFQDTRWHGKLIKRGDFITSYPKLSQETKLTIQQVRTALDKLQSTKEITVESTTQHTKITVNNYNTYQLNNKGNNGTLKDEQQTNNRRATNSEEDKEEEEEYKKINNKKSSRADKKQSGKGTVKTSAQDDISTYEGLSWDEWLKVRRDEYRRPNASHGLSHPSSKFLQLLYKPVDEGGYGLTPQNIKDAEKYLDVSKPAVMWLLDTRPKSTPETLRKKIKEAKEAKESGS